MRRERQRSCVRLRLCIMKMEISTYKFALSYVEILLRLRLKTHQTSEKTGAERDQPSACNEDVVNKTRKDSVETRVYYSRINTAAHPIIIIVVVVIIAKPLWTVASLHYGHGRYTCPRPSNYEVTFRRQSRSGSTKSFVVDHMSIVI